MNKKVTAIFDIGKTNKKFFLFDLDYKEAHKEYQIIEEIADEDGFPCDDLTAIENWIKSTLLKVIHSNKYQIEAVNFSTYGASFVHIDKNGDPILPLYNYLKPLPQKYTDQFLENYGPEVKICNETASPEINMLSSGLQLYWIKYSKPDLFKKIKYSLHLPNYLSYIFTKTPITDYTSIGCHTMLWDHSKKDYHKWVYKEKLDLKFAPITSSKKKIDTVINDHNIKFGVGIHDSSAALLPYLKSDNKKFVLISTGTWSVALNPFFSNIKSKKLIQTKVLNYMRINGKTVNAEKVFLGNEYKIQVDNLVEYFGVQKDADKQIKFSKKIYQKLLVDPLLKFKFESLHPRKDEPTKNNFSLFNDFKTGYHQLMVELIDIQVEALKSCIGKTKIEKIYIDGGFSNNDVFVKILSYHFKNYKIRTTESALGSALGAAMVISENKIGNKFLKKNYNLEKIKSIKLN